MQDDSKAQPDDGKTPAAVPLVSVYEMSPHGYKGSCLRPLGLCELGGCCDTCWYGPNHPRHAEKDEG